jgi:hypothetical protein
MGRGVLRSRRDEEPSEAGEHVLNSSGESTRGVIRSGYDEETLKVDGCGGGLLRSSFRG